MNMDDDVFADQTFGKIALQKLKKIGPLHPSFRLYEAGWLEQHPPFETMKVTGSRFRVALRGPREGQLCMKVPATDRTVYVTAAEMKAFEKKMRGAAL